MDRFHLKYRVVNSENHQNIPLPWTTGWLKLSGGIRKRWSKYLHFLRKNKVSKFSEECYSAGLQMSNGSQRHRRAVGDRFLAGVLHQTWKSISGSCSLSLIVPTWQMSAKHNDIIYRFWIDSNSQMQQTLRMKKCHLPKVMQIRTINLMETTFH